MWMTSNNEQMHRRDEQNIFLSIFPHLLFSVIQILKKYILIEKKNGGGKQGICERKINLWSCK